MQTKGQTDMTKLIVTFRNFAMAHENVSHKLRNTVLINMLSPYPSALENSDYTDSNVTLPAWIRMWRARIYLIRFSATLRLFRPSHCSDLATGYMTREFWIRFPYKYRSLSILESVNNNSGTLIAACLLQTFSQQLCGRGVKLTTHLHHQCWSWQFVVLK
jgi:hypothetical protein